MRWPNRSPYDTRARRGAARLLVALLTGLALAGVARVVAQTVAVPDAFRFDGGFTSLWLPSAVQQTALDRTNRIPLVVRAPTPFAPELYVWDHWPVRTPDGAVAVIDGWVVLVALTAERDAIEVPGARHGIARWRYWFTRGDTWQPGGLVFEEGSALGGRQWAGSTVYDPETGRATFYYTALGDLPDSAAPPLPDSPGSDCYEEVYYSGGGFRPDEGGCSTTSETIDDPEDLQQQAIAVTSARVVASESGIAFEEFAPHEIILTADGEFYTTAAQVQLGSGGLYIFRDPWYFRDPADGEEYLLFTAASAIQPGPKSGVAGVARRTADGWELLPPLIAAPEVNAQIERPHVVVRDDRYYLFFTSHAFSFAEDLDGPEGLYGMVSDSGSLFGRYVPLNGSGLVLGNPEVAPLQVYSFVVLPDGGVMSFINYVDLGDVTLEEIKLQSPEFQRDRFGGSPAPLLQLALEGPRTRLAEAPPLPACAGDCDGDGRTSVDEILRGVSLAASGAAPDECPALDLDGDGLVRVDELVAAVDRAISGCS